MRVKVAWPSRLGRTRVRATSQPSEQNLATTNLRYQRRNGRILLILQRTHGLLARMVRHSHGNLRDIVFVIRFRQLVADTRMQRVGITARFAGRRNESGVHSDADNVASRGYRRLAISAVQNEVLPLQLPNVE